jgi:hypothetical protein
LTARAAGRTRRPANHANSVIATHDAGTVAGTPACPCATGLPQFATFGTNAARALGTRCRTRSIIRICPTTGQTWTSAGSTHAGFASAAADANAQTAFGHADPGNAAPATIALVSAATRKSRITTAGSPPIVSPSGATGAGASANEKATPCPGCAPIDPHAATAENSPAAR